jgi:hypothetical protein
MKERKSEGETSNRPQPQSKETMEIEIKTNNLILTKLTLGWWHGNRTSHGLEQEVAENQKGQADAFRVVLRCMPPEFAGALTSISREMDKAWRTRTLPYEDGGWRVMRADKYEALKTAVELMAAKRREIVDNLIAHHDEIITYARTHLGKAYRDGMIPPPEVMRSQFRASLRPKPIPTAATARLLNASETVKQQIEQQMTEQLEEAIAGVKNEIKGVLQHFISELLSRLGKFKKGNGSRYGALLASLGKAAAQFRALGVLDGLEPVLDAVSAIAETDSKDLRESSELRKALGKELANLNAKIEESFA